MTQKEKAKELVEKFMPFCFRVNEGGDIQVESAKQCALICVIEILNSHKLDYDKRESTTYWHAYDFWQQVKEEIDKTTLKSN